MTDSEQKLRDLGELLIEAAESGRQIESRPAIGAWQQTGGILNLGDNFRLAPVTTYYRVFRHPNGTLGTFDRATPFDDDTGPDLVDIIKDFSITE